MKKHNTTEKDGPDKPKQYNGTYPIVFGKGITIHPESLKLLKVLNVNIEAIYKYLGMLMAKHHDLCNNRLEDVIIPETEIFKNI